MRASVTTTWACVRGRGCSGGRQVSSRSRGHMAASAAFALLFSNLPQPLRRRRLLRRHVVVGRRVLLLVVRGAARRGAEPEPPRRRAQPLPAAARVQPGELSESPRGRITYLRLRRLRLLSAGFCRAPCALFEVRMRGFDRLFRRFGRHLVICNL